MFNAPQKKRTFSGSFRGTDAVVQENEIENADASFDEVDFVFTAVADVLAFDLAIETAGEQVIHDATLRKALRTDVFEPSSLLQNRVVRLPQ